MKRLHAELAEVSKPGALPPFLLHLGPADGGDAPAEDDLTRWTCVMRGGEGSGSYAHGCWRLVVRVHDGYPMKPPGVRFVTPVCHPNVDFKVRGLG